LVLVPTTVIAAGFALVPITLLHRDDGAIRAALMQLAGEVLGQTLERSFPDLSL
jgi:hypothetical protein